MKRKLMLFTGVLVLVLMFIGPMSASAQAPLLWANTTIDRLLQTSAQAQVRLTEVNGVFIEKLFNIDNPKQNAMLAVLLTALSLDKVVRVAFYDGNPATIVLVGTID